MSTFHLKVLTVDRVFFEGDVERIVVRTTQGDVGILPNHVKYLAALGICGLTIIADGKTRTAAVAGGFLEVSKEKTVFFAPPFEWGYESYINRVESAEGRAKCQLQQKTREQEKEISKIKLKKNNNSTRQ